MKKIRIAIPERTNLNEEMLKERFQIVANPYHADFIICQSTIRDKNWPLNKIIYIAIEPPLAPHRKWCYSNFDKFHSVFCHDPKGKNEFPFTENDEAQFYPTYADPYPFRTREDTKFRNKGIFYAGMIGFYENEPDSNGGINITHLRSLFGYYFQSKFPESMFIGRGWNGQSTKVEDWRRNKLEILDTSPVDFVLALENTIYPNYLYEKIWDGFASDRVTLYLGDPNVEKHIPLNCFIDLRPYFDVSTKKFDFHSLGEYLENMTQEEYDEIIKNMREFRVKSEGKYKYHMDRLTQRIIQRIITPLH